MRRRFNERERWSMYLTSGGRCGSCGKALSERDFHADHIHPHSKGGATDVVNGQALCAACNLQKGSSAIMTRPSLRRWQRQAQDRFYELGQPRDYVVSATPGAGKTAFALDLAAQLIHEQVVSQILVVVPTDSLRQQWADAGAGLGIDLLPVEVPADYGKSGYQGFVVSYPQMARGVGSDMARSLMGRPTLAILDEVHHAGDNKSWGEGLDHAVQLAAFRLALTGTPWRRDQDSPIPFVTYDQSGEVQVDYAYEYGTAVADGVCRRVEFHAYDGSGRWIEAGTVSEATLGAELNNKDSSAVLDAVYQPSSEWMPSLLQHAHAALLDLRQDVPDAGGLVVAEKQWHAQQYAELLTRITGQAPTLVISDEKDSKSLIDQYRSGTSPWIVAVRMVSEGVDIPRLAVGVFASKAKTPLFFRQVVGRLVRTRSSQDTNARLFMPAVPALATLAQQIEEELRHELALAREQDDKARVEAENAQQSFDLRQPLSSSEAMFDRAILSGTDFTVEERAEAESDCMQYGVPVVHWPAFAQVRREQGRVVQKVTVKPEPAPEPKHRREKMLRAEVESTARRVAYREDIEPKRVNSDLYRAFGPRAKADIDALERMLEYLARRLER